MLSNTFLFDLSSIPGCKLFIGMGVQRIQSHVKASGAKLRSAHFVLPSPPPLFEAGTCVMKTGMEGRCGWGWPWAPDPSASTLRISSRYGSY